MASKKVGIVNLKEFTKQIDNLNKASEKVLNMTVNDFRRRAPGWVATEVAKRYNIKKSEIVPAKTGKDFRERKKKIGTVTLNGTTIDSVSITYKGRRLTPVRFGMSPKAPKPGSAYTLKAQIIKGERKTLGQVKKLTKKQRKNIGRNFTKEGTKSSSKSPIMLMHTGNKQPGGTNYIPFQRQSQRRDDLKAIKTISLPQMVSNEDVSKEVNKVVNENIGKRFEHYMERYMSVEDK